MTWVVEQTAEKLEKLDAKAAKEEKEEQKEAQLQDALAVTIPKNVTTLPHAGSQMVLSMLQALNRRKEFVASEVGFTYSLLFTFRFVLQLELQQNASWKLPLHVTFFQHS